MDVGAGAGGGAEDAAGGGTGCEAPDQPSDAILTAGWLSFLIRPVTFIGSSRVPGRIASLTDSRPLVLSRSGPLAGRDEGAADTLAAPDAKYREATSRVAAEGRATGGWPLSAEGG